jgi:hypothetical protein
VTLLAAGRLCVLGGDAGAAEAPGGRFGIRLLEAPVDRRDDPRARTYVVDHVTPGTTLRRHVEVSNASGATLRPEIFPAAAEIQNGVFGLAPGRTPNELSRWISVDRPRLVMPPHSTRRLLATVRVPPYAAAGERYAVLWAQVTAPRRATENVTMVNRVGIRVYLDVGPGGEPASDFRIETLTPVRGHGGRPVVRTEVRNTGRRALDLNGTLTLTHGPGSLRAGPFRATPGTTLGPGQAGAVEVVLDRRTPAGPWQALLKLYSGRVRREATAAIAFPAEGAGPARRPDGGAFARVLLLGLGGAATAGLGLVLLRRRRRPRPTGPYDG